MARATLSVFREWLALQTLEATQREFAEKLGITPSYLNDLIQGRRLLSVELAVKIQKVCKGFDARLHLHEQLDEQIDALLPRKRMSYGALLQATVGAANRRTKYPPARPGTPDSLGGRIHALEEAAKNARRR